MRSGGDARNDHDGQDRDPHPPDGEGEGYDASSYRVLMDDDDLAARFDALVTAAQLKGFSAQELGFGLLSATAEKLLQNGEAECCVMQLLVDFMSSFYESWHNSMGTEPEIWQGGEPANN